MLLLDEPTAALDPDQRRRLWERVAALRARGGAVVFATQNLEEVERDRRPRRRAARGPARLHRHGATSTTGPTSRVCRREPDRPAAAQGHARAAALAAAARDPARLPARDRAAVGLVASYGSSKPRVAFVDEDNLPATVVLGGKRFDVDHTIDEASKKVKLVRLSPERGEAPARRRPRRRRRDRAAGLRLDAARDGPEPAARAPALDRHDLLARRAAGAGARLLAQPPAPERVHREQPPLRDADPARRRRQLPRRADHRARDREGTAAAARDAADAADGAAARLPPRRAARAREHERRAPLDRAPDRARARAGARAHVGALGRGPGLRARADDHLPGAAARGRLARRRARRERRRPARARPRRARPARLVEGRAGRRGRAGARARDRARLRADHRDRRRHRRRAVAAAAAARGRARARGRLASARSARCSARWRGRRARPRSSRCWS